MIKTSTQLKALVRNRSGGNSLRAQMIIRSYVMERFLERLSRSRFRSNFIVKGGALITSMIGIEKRSTMDIDLTLRNFELSERSIRTVVQEIINIDLSDSIIFSILDILIIMEDFEYPGIRVLLNSEIDRMSTPLKLDFSTGDIITPSEVDYSYALMFEDRSISLLAYNLETILSEKFETIVSRGIANTRMRDFYDIYSLQSIGKVINEEDFVNALKNTSSQRNSYKFIEAWKETIELLREDVNMQKLWESYQKKFDYALNLSWDTVIEAVVSLGVLIDSI